MKKILFILSLVAIISCKNEEKQNADKTLVGGWSEAEVTPQVEAALNYVISESDFESPLKTIVSIKTQIVSGKNYDIDFELNNGELWNVIVYEDLNGNYKITAGPNKN